VNGHELGGEKRWWSGNRGKKQTIFFADSVQPGGKAELGIVKVAKGQGGGLQLGGEGKRLTSGEFWTK